MKLRLRRPICPIACVLILALLCAVFTNLCAAQEHALAPEKRTQIEAAVARFMATTHVPGLSIAVVENSEMEWASGFGFADLENNVPGQRTHPVSPSLHLQILDCHSCNGISRARQARS